MKKNKISTKIRTIGIIFFLLMLSILVTTIYLNHKNEKDALIINIAGKERMLTQKISKNIFYSYQTNNIDFTELDKAVEEFIYKLYSLKNGNALLGIGKVPTTLIAEQLSKVEILWNSFYANVKMFKSLSIEQKELNKELIKHRVDAIYKTNNNLLQEVDNLVSMYTTYAEDKTSYMKYFQYFAGILLLILIAYGFGQLKTIETNAQEFLDYSKKIIENPENIHIEPMKIDAESEIVEASNTLNCFIDKVNSAMDYSTIAIEQSKNAAKKLEEITDEFDKVLHELKDSTDITSQLDMSEDMAIESTEELINSTKKLQKLKDELDKLLINCQTH